MATNEHEEEEAEPTRGEVLKTFLGSAVADVTDTGKHTGISLRVWVLIVVIGLVVATAQFPMNVIGQVALLALALTLASRVRASR